MRVIRERRDIIMEAILFISQLAYQKFVIPIPTLIIFIFLFMASMIFVFFSHSYQRRKRSVTYLSLPPGPTPWPIFGCLPTMWRNAPPHRWIHAVMKQLNTEIACIRLGNTYTIPVTSPELALEFLKKHDSVFASRPISMTFNKVSRGFLNTIFSPSGDQWNKMRKVLASHVLNSSTLCQMARHRTMEHDALVHYIFNLTTATNNVDNPTSGAVVNLRSITLHYCGNIMRRMLLNRRYYNDGQKNGGPTFEEEEHVQALITLITHVHTFSISDYIPCLKWFDLDGHQKVVREALKVISKYDDSIIDERARQWKNGKNKMVNDILDIFISLKHENGTSLLSIQEIKAEITDLQIATIDNPSNAVEWAMVELVNEPKILQRAIEELDRVVGKDRLVQESDIPQLKYLMACIRESFRLHPFSPFNAIHVATSDVNVANYFIPKGSHVMLSRLGLGRNPRIWENPLLFDPNRHLDENTIELRLLEPSLRFITFSRGRRGCIGSTLGTTITMMLFARLLQGFSWSLRPGTTQIDFPNHIDEIGIPNPLQLYAQPRLSHNLYPNLN